MKETLNMSLWCLLVVVAMRLAFDAKAQTVETPTAKTEHVAGWNSPQKGVITFEGKIADEWHYWLWVQRYNLRDYEERGYDPCYTSIITTYKPVAKKRDDGQWEVTFTSDVE